MVQTSLEQCWNKNKTPEEEEQQVLLPHHTAAKKNTTNNNVALLHNSIISYETTGYATSKEEDELTFLGDHTTNSEAEDDDDDGWMKNQQLEDPVGDIITDMLNEGSIPYFGYQNYLQQMQQQQQQQQNGNYFADEDASFDWTHILCIRNFRALRRMIMGVWMASTNHNNERLGGGRLSSMKFLQETFLILLVLAFAISDVALRTSSWLVIMTFMWVANMLIDVDELHHGLVKLVGGKRIELLTNGMNQCRTYWKRFMDTIHMDFLWGNYFQGRSIVWSEGERLPKFRRKHIALIRTIKERRQNAKTTRRLERNIKKSRRKGLTEDAAEAVIVNEAKILLQARKKELDATAKELNQKPPTYFPTSVSMQKKEEEEEEGGAPANNLPRSTATKGHMEALRFCHKMVFLRDQEAQQKLKQEFGNMNDVSITHTSSTSELVDRIEVVSKDVNMSPYLAVAEIDEDSTACSEFPSIGEHWDSESDGDSESYADSVSTSEQALPWLAVGAKIGNKLLNSQKFQRIVANPDEIQKTLPNEAMKLIDGMDIPDEANEIAADLLIAKSKSTERKMKREKEKEQKQEMKLIKRPVHGMWSSPAGATLTPVMAKPLPQQGSPSRFPVIEMPGSFSDPSFSTPAPLVRLQDGLLKQPSIDRQHKQINRLAPIKKGVRIIVPLFSPDPNISINVKSSSFYQMVSLVLCAFTFSHVHKLLNFLIFLPSCFSRGPSFLLADATFHQINRTTCSGMNGQTAFSLR